jgi:hypothetical protein
VAHDPKGGAPPVLGRLIGPLVSAVVAVAVATTVVGMSVVPVTSVQIFSGQIQMGLFGCSSNCVGSYSSQTFPTRTEINLQWNVSGGGVFEVIWVSYANPYWIPCGSWGTSGSCSFLSYGGPYTFTGMGTLANLSGQTIYYQGSYTG